MIGSGAVGRGGFTLIEVIGALVIFSLGVLSVIQLTGSLATEVENAAITSELVVLVQEGVDSLSTAGYEELETGADSDTLTIRGRLYRRTVTVTQFSPLLRKVEVALGPDAEAGPSLDAVSFVSASW